jgi:hypothetical protein
VLVPRRVHGLTQISFARGPSQCREASGRIQPVTVYPFSLFAKSLFNLNSRNSFKLPKFT